MKLFLLLALAYPDASATSYFMSATGNDGNNGLSAGVPWLSPNHALNCGDTITAAASTAYSATNFGSAKWGTVTCAGNNNVAWVQCAAFDGCKITVSANFGMFVSKSYWGVQGFEVAETGNGGLCFGVIPAGGSTIHHIILANNICNGGANGFASSPQNTTAGVDYLVLLGNIAWNAAQSTTLCNSGITNYEPIKSDSLSGTHNYIAGNFLFDNSSPTNCLGGSATFDGNGIALDDLGNAQQSGTPYDQLTVVENNISVWNGGYGLGVTGNGNPSAPVIFRNNTSVHNWTSVNSSATTCGDVGFLASSFTTAYGNLIQTAGATGCSGPTALYGFAVNGANGTDSVYGNFIYSASGSNTTSVSSPGFSYGTNLTGANPLLANPVDPGQPNCTGKTSTVDCMSAVIANFRPALAAAQPYGYQQPGVSPVANGLYPQWLCNVTLLAFGFLLLLLLLLLLSLRVRGRGGGAVGDGRALGRGPNQTAGRADLEHCRYRIRRVSEDDYGNEHDRGRADVHTGRRPGRAGRGSSGRPDCGEHNLRDKFPFPLLVPWRFHRGCIRRGPEVLRNLDAMIS